MIEQTTHPDEIRAAAQELRLALLRASRRLRREAHVAGLSGSDAILLSRIKRSPGVGVCDLAGEERISRPSMSGRIKRLEAAGLVERRDDANDGRRSGLVLTRAGLRKVDAIKRHRNDWLAARLAVLGPHDRARIIAAVEPLMRLVDEEARA